mmetsp:Transcript_37926/g.72679  ORF Transcript_37926/g.72679 Transcript_37926/m.72679 type:complete len:254 (-) Transcript_37926:465-1226(-)|eukprot:CAMPEP_0114231138 /NCGR_PEP_ID=MMETSP0058-20121206/3863_1 /TAXON_ID=36894 /ORGANISM="Pyramimonas parkeae, CCMP726" /LENGTH=253 /DNA_ID=CAMNT_0001342425 /DNA_START=115 /DNA_END=876 /DNA_ORIENTATION=-
MKSLLSSNTEASAANQKAKLIRNLQTVHGAGIPPPPAGAAASWSEQQIRDYFSAQVYFASTRRQVPTSPSTPAGIEMSTFGRETPGAGTIKTPAEPEVRVQMCVGSMVPGSEGSGTPVTVALRVEATPNGRSKRWVPFAPDSPTTVSAASPNKKPRRAVPKVTAAQLVPATPLPLVNRDLFRNLKTGCEIPVKVDPKAEKRALGGLRTLGGLSRFMIGAAALMCFRGLAGKFSRNQNSKSTRVDAPLSPVYTI